MAKPYMSQSGYIGLAKQTASGTGAYTTPAKYMYVNSVSIEPDTDLLISDPEIGSGRDIIDSSVLVGPIKWTGSLDFNVRPEAIGLLLLGATGAVTSSGITGAAYGHTFTFQNDLVPLSIENSVGNGLEVFGYSDCKVNTLHFEAAAGEIVTGNAEIIAIQETSGKTNQAETFETSPMFTYQSGSVILDSGEISVKSFSFDINNNIADDDFRFGSRTLASLVEKRRELAASLEIVPTDSSVFKKSVYGASTATTVSGLQTTYSGSLFLRFESAYKVPGTTVPYQMDITIPKAVFQAAPFTISGDDMIVETLDLLPVKQSGSDIATIVLRNSTSSY